MGDLLNIWNVTGTVLSCCLEYDDGKHLTVQIQQTEKIFQSNRRSYGRGYPLWRLFIFIHPMPIPQRRQEDEDENMKSLPNFRFRSTISHHSFII